MELQITTLTKIFEYDRAFHARVGDEVVVGIAHQSLFRASANALREFRTSVEDQNLTTLRGVPVRFVPVELTNAASLDGLIERHELDFLYLTPLRSVNLRDVTARSQAAGVPTLTGVAAYVDEGIAVGVTLQGQRLRILVNLPAARAEGLDLGSQLLRLATVIGTDG